MIASGTTRRSRATLSPSISSRPSVLFQTVTHRTHLCSRSVRKPWLPPTPPNQAQANRRGGRPRAMRSTHMRDELGRDAPRSSKSLEEGGADAAGELQALPRAGGAATGGTTPVMANLPCANPASVKAGPCYSGVATGKRRSCYRQATELEPCPSFAATGIFFMHERCCIIVVLLERCPNLL